MPTEPPLLLDLAPPSDAAPAEPPPDFRLEAQDAFVDMIRAAGKTAYLMPTSCALYVRQYLGAFEPERTAVAEALRLGVPERIAQHPGREGYDDYLKEEAAKLAANAGLTPGLAWGAVECWAAGVGKPSGSVAPRPVARSLEVPEPKPAGPDPNLRLAMTAVAAAGGFTGGFFGNGFAYLGMLLGSVAVDASMSNKGPGAGEVALLVVLLVHMTVGGLAGAVGAGAGWAMGRGDERPWAGFAAAAGAAFVTGAVASAIRGPRFGSAVAILIAAFGTTYRVASSGGYRT